MCLSLARLYGGISSGWAGAGTEASDSVTPAQSWGTAPGLQLAEAPRRQRN